MDRYSRQILFLGEEKQKEIMNKRVAVIGLGGIGSPAAEYLARAGVNLLLIDRDVVEKNNLQRQFYTENDVGLPKSFVMKKRLEEANSEINIEAVCDDIDSSNIEKIIRNVELIIDGTDNMETRFLINDYCVKNRIPFTYAAAIRDKGIFAMFRPKRTACLRCLIRDMPEITETCETEGVIGTMVGLVGIISANEAIKFLSGEKPENELIFIDGKNMKMNKLRIKKNKNCKTCNGNYKFLNKKGSNFQKLCNSFQTRAKINISDVCRRIKRNTDFLIEYQGNESAIISYLPKNIGIILFKNRLIVKTPKEREAKILANKIIGR